MEHSFNVELATKYGILETILLQHIYFWIEKNKANNKHFYDNKWWTYNSKKAFSELFPYATERKIQLALDKLINAGLLECGNYNKTTFDKTKWYSITQNGYSILQNVQSIEQNVQPIPDINTDIKEINNNKLLFTKKVFKKPTLDEVKNYCQERNNNIDAEKFIDYYESNGWKVGRNSMKDWKACVRTWEKNKSERNFDIKTYQSKRLEEQEKARQEFLKGG